MGEPMPLHRWVFPARVLRVIDGDTLEIEIDQGMHNRRIERIRLLGVDTPEMTGATKAGGLMAKSFTEGWVAYASYAQSGWPLRVRTEKADSFGRYLALVWRVNDGASLNDDLITNGYSE